MRRVARSGKLSRAAGRLSRRRRFLLGGLALLLFAMVYAPFLALPVQPTMPPDMADRDMAELWRPTDVAAADLFHGPWGVEFAPDPDATYTFLEPKRRGASPGLTVRDPNGIEWSVKQGAEGPIEPTVSRVLSAIGYHQPPVYYLPSFALSREGQVVRAAGGRFRPKLTFLKEVGDWSWQRNPFVGTAPYQGLLVVLLLFNSSDIKNANNSVYELLEPREGATRWLVVRDIGASLGETGRLDPKRGDPDLFDRIPFITGVRDGFVEFSYAAWHQELVRGRIRPSDVQWACDRLARLSDPQWADAFRAGGYTPEIADRFIRRIKAKIEEGQRVPRDERHVRKVRATVW
ncbi:MAG: hypothetical protein HY655_06720 [Acidobacteria bacterium]|nr:hypothetical protein [Acidobacteriota bacterium]